MIKTWLGKCLYQGNTGIQVWQNSRYRWLSFSSSSIQSIMHRKNHHQPATHCVSTLMYPARILPGSMLHLGLGGACVPHALTPFRNGMPWTFVESSLEVIDLAKRFFWLNELEPLHMIHRPAEAYVRETLEQYQHVMVDLSNANFIPKNCSTADFFQHIKRILSLGGIATINVASPSQHLLIAKHLDAIFDAKCCLNVKGMSNRIFFAASDISKQSFIERLQLETHCKSLQWNRSLGVIGELPHRW